MNREILQILDTAIDIYVKLLLYRDTTAITITSYTIVIVVNTVNFRHSVSVQRDLRYYTCVLVIIHNVHARICVSLQLRKFF